MKTKPKKERTPEELAKARRGGLRDLVGTDMSDWGQIWVLKWGENGEYLVRRLHRDNHLDPAGGELKFHRKDLTPKTMRIVHTLLEMLSEQAYWSAQFSELAKIDLKAAQQREEMARRSVAERSKDKETKAEKVREVIAGMTAKGIDSTKKKAVIARTVKCTPQYVGKIMKPK